MAHVPGTRQTDVDRSFQALIKANFEDAVVANNGKVIYSDHLKKRADFSEWWVEVHKIVPGCRQGIATVYQIDVVYEIGDESDQATLDRYGDKAMEKAESFLELVIPDNDLPFKVDDYRIKAAPVPTEYYARVIDEIGTMGEPSPTTLIFDQDKGLVHVFLNIPVKHAVDLIRLPLYRG